MCGLTIGHRSKLIPPVHVEWTRSIPVQAKIQNLPTIRLSDPTPQNMVQLKAETDETVEGVARYGSHAVNGRLPMVTRNDSVSRVLGQGHEYPEATGHFLRRISVCQGPVDNRGLHPHCTGLS